ncbi:MAG TPA: hypothetical protein PKD59_18070 [Miltoncostaeaceae bacterium]|nr:hypothetical protein [Miltoncostaeaceae bacterium]
MSPSRSSLRHRTLAIVVLLAAAALAPLPAALAWPAGTCAPAKDRNCVVDVSIAKTSDRDTYTPGDVVTYTITVTNTGNTAVLRERIRVSDPSLANLAPDGPPTTGWLKPGETVTWTGTRAVTAAECGQLPNTATVSLVPAQGDLPDSNPGNDTATRTVVVAGQACTPPVAVVPVAQAPSVAPPVRATQVPACPRPTLAAVVRGPKNPKAGSTTKYHVTVRTTGVTATRVTVRLTLPAGFSLPGTGVATLRDGQMVVGVGTLVRGRARTIPVVLKLDRSTRGPRTMRVTVGANCGGTVTAIRTVQAVAVAPARVQPAVTG